jgi:hypothetical protein
MKTATLLIAAALGCGAVVLQAPAQPAAGAAVQPGSVQVEPKAIDALTRMSAHLRTIPAFQVTIQTQRDDVDAYGQLITLSGQATYKVRRPDAFSIDLALPTLTRLYVYDGKTVTVYDRSAGAYGRFQAPSTIRDTVDLAEKRYGATFPLVDLFHWTEGDDRAKSLTSAHFIGQEQVAGQTTNHYAFRQPGIDWQIWIADGDQPKPLRVAIVSSDDPARPKFEADLSWDTTPQFAANTFAFAPPPNARAVDLRPAN